MKLRILSLLLVLMLLGGCASRQEPWEPLPSSRPQGTQKDSYRMDYSRNYCITGSVQAVLAPEASGGRVSYNDVYPGISGKDYTDPEHYTRQDYISGTTGMKWAPHTWETADDSYILELTTTGFYSFVLNRDKTGYTIVDEMALGPPEDVTEEYVGKFGIGAGEQARAWQINLNPNACWENGEPINADTYLYSYQQLLDSKMKNRRADSLYAGEFSIVGARDYLYGKAGWDQVGILKTGEYRLVFVTTAQIPSPEFYVPYYLSSTYLVYEPLWESCKTYLDQNGNPVPADSANVASVSTNYCTSVKTSISYGPYRLAYFELDKQITLERNPTWYGYSDGKHLGQYQTDRISCQAIGNHATALLGFLSGDIDTIGLESADMDTYAGSDRIRYEPQSYTTKLSFNIDAQALAQRGSQVLSNPTFRKAFSLAIDRTAFTAAFTSAGAPGYGLLNEQYVYDPFTGDSYRQSAGAKNALVQLFDLPYGSSSGYEDLQQAYDAITGYDPIDARLLMSQAYTECVESGLYDGKSPIRLRLSVYQSQDVYVQMYHFLNSALKMACRGTGFQGRISLEMVVDEDYYSTMESGLTDLIFSTWGGSAYDPYGLIYRCYCDKGVAQSPNQMEYGFDAGAISVEMTVNGSKFVHSLQDWARYCAGDPEITIEDDQGRALPRFALYDADTKASIYANVEFAYLSQYAVTSLYYRNGAVLLSRKGEYPLKSHMGLVEFGGLAFYTYHYSDEMWQQVKENMHY